MLTSDWFWKGRLIPLPTAHDQSLAPILFRPISSHLAKEIVSLPSCNYFNFEEIAFSLFPPVAAAQLSSMFDWQLLSEELLSIVRRVKHLITLVFNQSCNCTCQLKNSWLEVMQYYLIYSWPRSTFFQQYWRISYISFNDCAIIRFSFAKNGDRISDNRRLTG